MNYNSQKIAITARDGVDYPTDEACYSPSTKFEEYPFVETAGKYNGAYEMVRQTFVNLGMDAEHLGTENWNPLGEVIRPGQTVLLKPNWVMHRNPEPKFQDMDCMVTHPSIIRAVLDYVYIALKGAGTIIVADSPVKECDFQQLQERMHYESIWGYYQNKGIEIRVLDLRGFVERVVDGVETFVENESLGVKVVLRNSSCFEELSEKQIGALRVHTYPSKMMRASHWANHHEYIIHPEVLNADVIINLPKPKTHKKSGLTACAKNFVGAFCRKEQLPHHRTGSPLDGGDEYLHQSLVLRLASWLQDRYSNSRVASPRLARLYYRLYHRIRRFGQMRAKEQYDDGAWYGNDTTWRTIVDLNRIILYADKSGVLGEQPQRKVFNICDMIVAGEGYGPLAPTPKPLGMVVMGECIPAMDWFICHVAHLKLDMVKYIGKMLQSDNIKLSDYTVVSETGSICPLLSYEFRDEWRFTPPCTWKGHLEAE